MRPRALTHSLPVATEELFSRMTGCIPHPRRQTPQGRKIPQQISIAATRAKRPRAQEDFITHAEGRGQGGGDKLPKGKRPIRSPPGESIPVGSMLGSLLESTGGPTRAAQGKNNKSLMRPAAWMQFHPFVKTLQEWEHGVPVDCGADWTAETLHAAVERGPHRSALSTEAMALIHEDVAYQVKAGFSRIVAWDDIKGSLPAKLKISPLAVVPQTNRRGRLILDLSFPVQRATPTIKPGRRSKRKLGEVLQESVNDSTTRLAPIEPVKELGQVLPRLLTFMSETPRHEHINFSKIDLSDGFWRMIVGEADCWNFAYVLPDPPGHQTRLVIPHALQMGWTESPGFFCAATETTRDIIQSLMDAKVALPPHQMEAELVPAHPAKRQRTSLTTWQMTAVFVDDFILAAVENSDGSMLRRFSRAALHSIHGLFPPPSKSGHVGGKDPISQKKLDKGDGRFCTGKEILGFELDGIHRTIRLPPSKAGAIIHEIKRLLRKNRVPLKRFQSITGKLQHAALILPSAKSLFTPLNQALRGSPGFIMLPKVSEVRAALLDFTVLIADLARRPTHVDELVAHQQDYVGYCDASAFGAGGVWFSGDKALPPTVWRVVFPQDITQAVVSYDNPQGILTNSDLEMAGVLLHQLVLERLVNIRHAQSVIHCDNTPSVAWVTRMASQATSPVAHRLLRGMAMRQRTTQSIPPVVVSIAGVANTLADVASRKLPPNAHVSAPEVPDEHFLTYFQTRFPLPQNISWQIVHPNTDMLSNVISTLRGKRLKLQRWTTPPAPQAGPGGSATPPKVTQTPTSAASIEPSNSSSSWPLPPGFELDFSGEVGQLDSKPWRKPYVTWHKPKCWLATPTQDEPMVPTSWTFPSDTC